MQRNGEFEAPKSFSQNWRRTISLPALNSSGELPSGVYPATLVELEQTFGCENRHRELLFQRIKRIYDLAASSGQLARFVVFGSFVTDKPTPNDVDILLIFEEAFDAALCDAEMLLLLDHAAADTHFGASLFWLRRPAAFGGEQATIDFWKNKREGGQRGIVEIVEEKT